MTASSADAYQGRAKVGTWSKPALPVMPLARLLGIGLRRIDNFAADTVVKQTKTTRLALENTREGPPYAIALAAHRAVFAGADFRSWRARHPWLDAAPAVVDHAVAACLSDAIIGERLETASTCRTDRSVDARADVGARRARTLRRVAFIDGNRAGGEADGQHPDGAILVTCFPIILPKM